MAQETAVPKARQIDETYEHLKVLEETQRATFNILDDFNTEKVKLEQLQLASMNILEDFDEERLKFRQIQQATLNLLEDMHTERTRLEQTQRAIMNMLEDIAAVERLGVVVEAAPNAMIMVDNHGKIAIVNQQTERLFGYTREELIGQKIELLVPERVRAEHPGYREGFSHSPKPRAMGAGRELFGLKKDGTEVPIEIGLSPIETPEGLSTLASVIDITDRKRAQEELNRSQAQLFQASKLASVGTLAAGVAHELNNPLAGILGFSQDIISLLQGGQFDIREVLEEAKLIEKAARRCNSIIENLSMFARRKSRLVQLTDIHSLLDEILPLIEKQITLQGIRIIKRYQRDLPKIGVNRDELQQVFVNLILNARQAMKGGGQACDRHESERAFS